MDKVDISVVLPVFNERENVRPLLADLNEALAGTGKTFEIIFIDDGSTDGSVEKLTELQALDPNVVVIEFRRNFGQTAALAAGLKHSNGEVVITLDADRQNDPKDIPMLLNEINKGMDLVCGWRHDRKDGLWLRLLPSRIANRLIRSIP